jgi:acetyltransferase-like isoleucine patch superfamily enzyme
MIRFYLKLLQAWDRWRLRRLMAAHPGVEIDPSASTNFALATFELDPGARLRIGPGVWTERRRGGVVFSLRAGAELTIGEGGWLRSDRAAVHIVIYERASVHLGPKCFLNGCQISAKEGVSVGLGSMIGPGARVYDADQHPFDADTPERQAAVVICEDVWVASDTTVLRGVTIGSHSIIGARSVVTRDIPEHTLAAGSPAKPVGDVGDRAAVRVL